MKKHILKENYNKIYLASQLHGNADVIGNKTQNKWCSAFFRESNTFKFECHFNSNY